MDNQNFITQASSGNMFEISAGNLALNTSTNTDVKTFASRMVTDHGTTAAEMASLAEKKGWSIPTVMLQKDQQNLDSLSSLHATAFDKRFAAIMVRSHTQTIDLFQMAASDDGVPDADLRAFAAAALPLLRQHLQLAQQLQQELGNLGLTRTKNAGKALNEYASFLFKNKPKTSLYN
jgi:putative membrane protein